MEGRAVDLFKKWDELSHKVLRFYSPWEFEAENTLNSGLFSVYKTNSAGRKQNIPKTNSVGRTVGLMFFFRDCLVWHLNQIWASDPEWAYALCSVLDQPMWVLSWLLSSLQPLLGLRAIGLACLLLQESP